MQQQSSILLWNYDDGILWHTCVMKKNILGLCNKRIYIWMDEEVRMFTSLNFTEW